jgi:nicotinamide mononucleotide adenylyltransferase
MRKAAAKYGRLYIGLTGQRQDLTGGSDREAAERNPLTYWERVEMWQRALTDLDDRLDHIIGPFPIERPELLAEYVPRSCVCATTIREAWNSEKTRRLNAAGYEVDVLFTDYDKAISGTDIRQRILSGSSDWTRLVTPRVAELLTELDIAARLRAASPHHSQAKADVRVT